MAHTARSGGGVSDSLNRRAASATKWSIVTETLVKVVSPVTQLVLARILAPEAFGMVATVTMVTSFADMFSDSGFQKYLVQHEFKSERELHRSANVAFWTNMAVSLILWAGIALARDPIAALVGSPGLGFPIAVACASLPLTSFSSIQLALFRRRLDFKTMMPVRVAVALVPLVVTVPLALAGMGFWSLIIGTIAGNVVNAVALTALSPWKPRLFYSFALLRDMFAFSGWSLLEAIAIWATSWAGTFVVGNLLDSYHLGLYRQPMTFVNSAFNLVTNATTPVLFASLSRLQGSDEEFRSFFCRFQFSVAMFVLPLGVGIFCFRDFLTELLLGGQWGDAALMMGCWGLSTGVMIVFSHYCSEVFRSKGKPKVSLLCQVLYMCVMVPTLYVSASMGFEQLVVANSVVRAAGIVINQTAMFLISGISFRAVLKGVGAPLVSSCVMGCAGLVATELAGASWIQCALGIVLCVLVYAASCMAFRSSRRFLLGLLRGRGMFGN